MFLLHQGFSNFNVYSQGQLRNWQGSGKMKMKVLGSWFKKQEKITLYSSLVPFLTGHRSGFLGLFLLLLLLLFLLFTTSAWGGAQHLAWDGAP